MSYNIQNSLTVLELYNVSDEDINENILKRQYRKLALLYHPDKNSDMSATDKFKELHESYEHVMRYYGYLDETEYDIEESDLDESYMEEVGININESSWFSFINPFLQSDIFLTMQSKLFHSIASQLYGKCEEKAYDLIEQLDADKMEKIIALLKSNKQTFHISDSFLEEVETMYHSKVKHNKTVILRPLLKDLFEEQVYKLVENEQMYYVPLWHHELVYDINGNELCVEINPIMDDNVEIDEKNNVIVYKQMSLSEILKVDKIDVILGGRTIKIPRYELKIRSLQQFVLTGQGIPQISTRDVYDVSKKTNIIIVIMLV